MNCAYHVFISVEVSHHRISLRRATQIGSVFLWPIKITAL